MCADPRPAIRGFTLLELLVALAIMALLALLSWRGVDGMARAQESTRVRTDSVVGLQNGLNQWSTDLDAMMDTGLVPPVDYDGRVLRLTRRDPSIVGSPLRVVGWSRRMIEGNNGGAGSWARWQSLPLQSPAELQQAWSQVELWAQNPGDAEKLHEVAIAGLDQLQIFYYRRNGGAWTNPLSTASSNVAPGAAAGTPAPPPPSGKFEMPDGIRLVLTLSAGQPLAGSLVKDWIRPTLGGGRA